MSPLAAYVVPELASLSLETEMVDDACLVRVTAEWRPTLVFSEAGPDCEVTP